MPKLGNVYSLPVRVQTYMSNQGGGKAMMLVVMDADSLPDCTPKNGMFARGLMTLTFTDCRDPKEALGGMRADQILTTTWDTEKMAQIDTT